MTIPTLLRLAQLSDFNQSRCRGPDCNQGFTIVEVIAATVIIAIIVISTIQATLSSLQVFNRAAARDSLETIISRDLGWLRAYSKSWHCQAGPYEGCLLKTQGLASAVNYLPEIYSEDSTSPYSKFKTLCDNRGTTSSTSKPSNQLLTDAAAISSTAASAPPNPIQQSEIVLSMGAATQPAKNYKIYRTIAPDSTGNGLNIRYYTKTTDSPTMPIDKSEQLFIEATAWCP